jgi:NAD(P)-dependent dehydrogenase (short-subunit alcohol dehydrogenase family)
MPSTPYQKLGRYLHRKGLRFNALSPGQGVEAKFEPEMAAARLGPLMQTYIPASVSASQLAASVTFLLSDDGTNIRGTIFASDGRWSAL